MRKYPDYTEDYLEEKYGNLKYHFWVWSSYINVVDIDLYYRNDNTLIPYKNQGSEEINHLEILKKIEELIGDDEGSGLLSPYAFVRDYWRNR
jgi:hypothetical protein